MLNRDSDYVKNYLNVVSLVANDILSENYSYLEEYKMPDKYGTVENGEWLFKIIKSRDTGICLTESYNTKLMKFLLDPNVICVGINRFPPGTYIKEHVDPPCYGKNLWRILVPIQAEDCYLNGQNGPQRCEVGKCYIIDLLYEKHNGWNNSKQKDFVVCTIDLLYEDKSDYGVNINKIKDNDYKRAVKIDLSLYQKC